MVTTVGLREAVAEAVRQVNGSPGGACIRLRFNSQELPELEILANAASLRGDAFSFRSAIENFEGRIEELLEIRAERLS